MKRFLGAFLVFCLACSFFSVPVHAAGTTTYDLEEPGIRIDLPDDWIVFHREMDEDDPNLRQYGWTRESLRAYLEELSIYLDAFEEAGSYEVAVTMTESPMTDFHQTSDASLNAMVPLLTSWYEAEGITVTKSEIYRHAQAKFVKIYLSQPFNGDTAYSLLYSTVYDGKHINIALHSYSGEIDSDQEALLKEITDSVQFDAAPQVPAPTPAFVYTDPDSGLTFTVPANWVHTPMLEEREFIDGKFTSNLEEGLCIIFASEDFFQEEVPFQLSVIEKFFLSRGNMGNDLFTKADVASIFGCEAEAVSMATYGDKEYFATELTQTISSDGISFSVPMVYLLRCENGYLYQFQFNGTKDSPYFDDFVSLVSSADYPVIADETLTQRRVIGAVFVLLCLLVVMVCIFLVRKRKSRNKNKNSFSPVTGSWEPDEKSRAASLPDSVRQTGYSADWAASIRFCHHCGAAVKEGYRFCHVCGANLYSGEGQE